MIPARKLPVRASDLVRARVRRNAENVVVVAHPKSAVDRGRGGECQDEVMLDTWCQGAYEVARCQGAKVPSASVPSHSVLCTDVRFTAESRTLGAWHLAPWHSARHALGTCTRE